LEDIRSRKLNQKGFEKGLVVYWMSRDQRAEDNYALLHASHLARKSGQPLVVVFTLNYNYPGANLRHFDFMLKGLQETETNLAKKNISLIILAGDPVQEILKFIDSEKVKILTTDFDPLKIKGQWKSELISLMEIPFIETDTHNIVPCWLASVKEEYAAFTFRPKIKKLIPEFLNEPPILEAQKHNPYKDYCNNWQKLTNPGNFDNSVLPVKVITPGAKEANRLLKVFIKKKLKRYTSEKNDPNSPILSSLSPHLHFGQISSQRITIEIIKCGNEIENTSSFLEELIVRKELSDNYCYYNPEYDNPMGFRNWAVNSLQKRSDDPREFIYALEDFETANTHDNLWNAAQMEMVYTAKMHGYMRMYWAKKILEWSVNPKTALATANLLNNKYSLDGRDPNGYTGTAWSIGGVHDRPWADRPVYGQIRYMNYNGCKRKFDVGAYISHIGQIQVQHVR
jgi:deoxyribodipyrimidine photo-lyase